MDGGGSIDEVVARARRPLVPESRGIQRAYEKRAQVKGTALSPDSVVLSAEEAAQLSDRVYQVRCAAEDVATAVDEGAEPTELRELCDALIRAAKAADGWR